MIQTATTYNRVAILMHWVTALLLLAALIIGWQFDDIDDKALKASLLGVHKTIGLLVLFLAFARLGWHLAYSTPPWPPMPAWQRISAVIVHWALYAIMIGMPDPAAPVLVRLHSECFTGDLLGSLRCDCGSRGGRSARSKSMPWLQRSTPRLPVWSGSD